MNRTLPVMRVAAVILALSFFLPLSSCSNSDMSAYSAYDWPSIGSTIAAILFFWPLVAMIVISRNASFSRSKILTELVLCIATLGGITWIVFWGQSIRYGAVVSYLAIVSYTGALIVRYVHSRR